MAAKYFLKGWMVLLLMSFSGSCAFAQGFQWAHNKTGGTSAFDNNGNVYTIGYFTTTIDFDAGLGVHNVTPIGGSDADLFILKEDADGNFIWVKNIGAPSGPQIANFAGNISITVDSLGYVYTSGNFYSSIDFDPGAGVYNLSTTTMDYFILKLNAAGDFAWAKNAGNATGNSYINISGHSQDANGNIYTTCSFRGTIDADPGTGVSSFSTQSSANLIADILIIKLDSAGNYIWAKQAGGQGINVPTCIALDSFANIYFAGSFNDVADFDPSPAIASLTSLGGINFGGDVFVAKWDSAGNYLWAKQIGGTSTDIAIAIAVDKHGSPLVAGGFSGTVDFDPGPNVTNITTTYPSSPFAFRLTSQGNLSWAQSIESFGEARGIATDSDNNVYVGGNFSNTADFNLGSGVYNLSPNGSRDGFIQKLDSVGNFLYAFNIGGSDADDVEWLGTDKWDNLYASGAYQFNVDFDPSGNTYVMDGSISSSFLLKLCLSLPILLEKTKEIFCLGETGNLFVPAIAGAAYIWTNNDVVVQSGANNTLQTTAPGSYQVTITGVGCPSTSNKVEVDFLPNVVTFIQSVTLGTGTMGLPYGATANIMALPRYFLDNGNSLALPTPYQVEWLINGIPVDTTYDSFTFSYTNTAAGTDTVTSVLSAMASLVQLKEETLLSSFASR